MFSISVQQNIYFLSFHCYKFGLLIFLWLLISVLVIEMKSIVLGIVIGNINFNVKYVDLSKW